MGDGIDSPELEGATPLELALDRATDQYMASMQERRGRRRSAARTSPTAMVVAKEEAYLPARLSWRGIEVTEEFQEYAMRVARGEQLEPFRGQVLARPCPEFPWSEPANEQEHTSTESLPRFRSRGPRAAAWLFGIGALVMGGLGIGSGTASPGDELQPFVLPPTTTALTLRPMPRELDPESNLAQPETRIASAIESALAHAVPAEGDTARATARALPSAPTLAASTRLPAPSAPVGAPNASTGTSRASLPTANMTSSAAMTPLASGQRTTPSIAPGLSVSASLAPAVTGGGAMPSEPARSSSLFSDNPSF